MSRCRFVCLKLSLTRAQPGISGATALDDQSGSRFRFHRLFQVFALGGNDLLVPVVGIFFASGEIACTVIMTVHIDESIALGILTRPGRYQINGTPGGVANEVHAILQGFGHGLDVATEVVDPVLVVN